MTSCLMVMHPREIKEVMNSIDQFDMPKVWFRGYNSLEIGPVMNKFVEETNYDNYIITSDDLILFPEAMRIIVDFPVEYPVVSGYCNMFVGSEHVGLCSKPLTMVNGICPQESDYELMTQEEVDNMPTDIFETYFLGYSLTRLSRELWIKYPFKKYIIRSGRNFTGNLKGVSSDHHISMRLIQAGIKMYTHKQAFVYHLKPAQANSRHGSTLRTNWLVGKETPSVIWEK